VAIANSKNTFQLTAAITMDTLHKTSFGLCLLAANACALCCMYFLFFAAAYDTAIPGIIAFGFSIGFATIAAVINPDGDK
jgi:hypothetical protein